MSEKPILFSTEMVAAIRDGRKTQTRRVMKPQPFSDQSYVGGFGWPYHKNSCVAVGAPHIGGYCPYGNWEGGRLWVRETFGLTDVPVYKINRPCAIWPESNYEDGYAAAIYRADGEWDTPNSADSGRFEWRPSIFMPRWASRITLEITGVRVERVQDISEMDARAEGYPQKTKPETARDWYHRLWDEINAKRGFGWDVNPWVWVISFEVKISALIL